RQWRERAAGGQDLVFWATTGTGPVQIIVESEPSVCFLEDASLEAAAALLGNDIAWRHAKVSLASFDQVPVQACYFSNQKHLNIGRARLSQAGLRCLEADLRPTDRYLMERFIRGGVEILGEAQAHDGYCSYRNPNIRPSDYLPDLKVVSLDIETSWTDHVLYSIAVTGKDVRRVFMVSREDLGSDDVECLPDERSAILRFLDWMRQADPDVLIGWNVVGFDLRFLQERCDELGLEFLAGRGGEVVHWRQAATGPERHFALMPGRVVLDGIELLRTATYRFESFALDYVARELLGRGKLVDDVDARASEIQDMYANDKPGLAEYNLEDCALVEEIFEKTDLLAFAVERCRMTGLDMDRAGGSVAAFDFLYLPRLHRAGLVAPVVDPESGVGGPGGYVLDSKPGLFDHVVVLDFKSLYPSIIRTFHVDPLALVKGQEESDAIEGFEGGRFSRRHFILPQIIEELWAERDKARKAGKVAMSQAIKIIMNSFYGVLGTPACRFFDARLVSSITRRGHEILKTTRDLIEEQGLTVIYGDTDSVFVLLKDVDSTAGAERAGNDLADHLNTWWRRHLEEELNLESCLEVEFETHYDRFLMPRIRGSEKGSKKRYAGLINRPEGPELVFKGLETVRSDWSQLAREFQQALYRKIFLDEPYEDFIRELVEKVEAGECDDKLVLRRRLRRKLVDYEKNVPPHVRAARNAEAIRRERGLAPMYQQGTWVEYVMTVNGPEPRAWRESKIDYRFYIDRQLAAIADAILSFRSTSLAEITDKQLG
ncbi:MAG: DNA polymerase II, partial [Pseudomonadales bacterium]|nr:DNA polymerase II [Pseudomonadales bacterium]